MPFIIDVIYKTTTTLVQLSRVTDNAAVQGIYRTFPRAFNAAMEMSSKLKAQGLVSKAANQVTEVETFIATVRLDKRKFQIDLENFKGFWVYPGLLSPKISRGGEYFGCNLSNLQNLEVADIGAGTGIVGLHALKHAGAKHVTFLDIMQMSIHNVKASVAQFGYQTKATTLKSDLFHAVNGKKFDAVLSNPPYVKIDVLPKNTGLHRSCYDPGTQLITRLFQDTRKHTIKSGQFNMLVSDQADLPKITGLIQTNKWHPQRVLIEGTPTGHSRLLYDMNRGGY